MLFDDDHILLCLRLFLSVFICACICVYVCACMCVCVSTSVLVHGLCAKLAEDVQMELADTQQVREDLSLQLAQNDRRMRSMSTAYVSVAMCNTLCVRTPFICLFCGRVTFFK
jgi:hypothetical protein